MMTDRPTTPELVITRTFDAPIGRVWDAWTQPGAIAQWLGPKGSTTHILDGDICPGGVLRTRMDTAHGSLLTAFFYREIVPTSRIVYEHCFLDESGALARPSFFPVWPLKLLTIVTLETRGAGTMVSVIWRPIDASSAELDAFAAQMSSMEGGWSVSFDQLGAHLSR